MSESIFDPNATKPCPKCDDGTKMVVDYTFWRSGQAQWCFGCGKCEFHTDPVWFGQESFKERRQAANPEPEPRYTVRAMSAFYPQYARGASVHVLTDSDKHHVCAVYSGSQDAELFRWVKENEPKVRELMEKGDA